MLDNREIESESSSDDEMPPLEDCNDMEVAKPVNGDILVTRHALSIQPKEDGDMEQREHNFHTRCHINDKDVQDVFLDEVPSGLPSIRGIEHHIDLIPGEEFDLRTNPFEEGWNDRNPTDKDKDHFHDTRGPMTRSHD
ncbi:hypothetical protein CR513_38392, partial [Mucuna pruriens]